VPGRVQGKLIGAKKKEGGMIKRGCSAWNSFRREKPLGVTGQSTAEWRGALGRIPRFGTWVLKFSACLSGMEGGVHGPPLKEEGVSWEMKPSVPKRSNQVSGKPGGVW